MKQMKFEINPPIEIEEFIYSSSLRNWSDLPAVLLILILDRLSFSLPDLFAFAGVCRSWRSVVADSISAIRAPPLLLSPVFFPARRWSNPARCLLQTLTGNSGVLASSETLRTRCVRSYKALVSSKILRTRFIRSYKTLVSSKTLRGRCIGCSHTQLILVAAVVAQTVVLADAFTGREIQSPNFPSSYDRFSFGILTAPLDSPSCLLLLVAVNALFWSHETSILCWRPGSSEWSELKIRGSMQIISLVVFKGHVFALSDLGELMVVEFSPFMGLKKMTIPKLSWAHWSFQNFNLHLVECGGDLLLVLFSPLDDHLPSFPARVRVYRLDLSKSMWVEIESLGDWCLFIDAVRKHAVSCPNPTSWGGRNNCIYFAGQGCDAWIVVPLDGEALNRSDDSPFSLSNIKLPKWPSSVWIYPRLAGKDIEMEGRATFSEP